MAWLNLPVGEMKDYVATNTFDPAPHYTAELEINRNFKVPFERMPNRWHRFWYWMLLGWKWREGA